MNYKVISTKRFRKDLKKQLLSRKITKSDFDTVIDFLVHEKKLPPKHCDHALKGDWKGFRECHLKPDLLLVYRQDKDLLILSLIRLGSHSDLF